MKAFFKDLYSGEETIIESDFVSLLSQNPMHEVYILVNGSSCSNFVEGTLEEVKKKLNFK